MDLLSRDRSRIGHLDLQLDRHDLRPIRRWLVADLVVKGESVRSKRRFGGELGRSKGHPKGQCDGASRLSCHLFDVGVVMTCHNDVSDSAFHSRKVCVVGQPRSNIVERRARDVVVAVVRHFDLDGSRRPAFQRGVRIAGDLLANLVFLLDQNGLRTDSGQQRAVGSLELRRQLVQAPGGAAQQIPNREHVRVPFPAVAPLDRPMSDRCKASPAVNPANGGHVDGASRSMSRVSTGSRPDG